MDPEEESLVCKHCGNTRLRDARFCTKCGAPTESSSERLIISESQRLSRSNSSRRSALHGDKEAFRDPVRSKERAESGKLARAFAISERQLSNPAFSSDEVTSSASLSPSYPGCPHCGADPRKEFAGISFVKCSCGKLACSAGIIGAETLCPWCDRIGTLVRHGPLPVLGIKDR